MEEPPHLVAGEEEQRPPAGLPSLDEDGRQQVTPVVEKAPFADFGQAHRPLHAVGADEVAGAQEAVGEGGHQEVLRGVVPLLGAERRGIELAIDHTRIAEQRLLLGRALVEEAALTAIDLVAELRAKA